MENSRRHIGAQIRRYRRAAGLTVEALAQAVHKSKSTVSKYETGEISLDVETLLEIADALHVSPGILLQRGDSLSRQQPQECGFSHREFLYFYDGRKRRISRSAMEHYFTDQTGVFHAMLFYDTPTLQAPEECASLYSGEMTQHGLISCYTLRNQKNVVEQVLIYSIDSLEQRQYKSVVLLGLSSYSFAPVLMKALVFPSPCKEDADFIKDLLLTKEELRLARKYNVLTFARHNFEGPSHI